MLESTFEFVLITSFYGGIVGIILLAIKRFFNDKLSPGWHYALWIVLLLKLLVPYGPQSSLSLFNMLPKEEASLISMEQLNTDSLTNPISYKQTIGDADELKTANELKNRDERQEIKIKEDYLTENYFKIDTLKEHSGIIPTTNQRMDKKALNKKELLSYIWLIGTFGVGSSFIGVYMTISKKLKDCVISDDKRLLAIQTRCEKQLGLTKRLPIILQKQMMSPALMGVFKLHILLPIECLKLEDKELEYILLHEMAHYKRKDYIINLLLIGFTAVHWFNPVLLYCFKAVRQDMEIGADEIVLTQLGEGEKKEYGKTLIKILETIGECKKVNVVLTMASDKKGFSNRIKHITHTKWLQENRKKVIVIGLGLLIGLSTICLTSMSKKENEFSKEANKTIKEMYRLKRLYEANENQINKNQVVSFMQLGDISYLGYINSFSANEREDLLRKVSFEKSENGQVIHITVKWDQESSPNEERRFYYFKEAVYILSLFDDLEGVTYHLEDSGKKEERYTLTYKRKDIENKWGKSLSEFGKSKKEFKKLVSILNNTLVAVPHLYTLDMNRTIGIEIKSRTFFASSEVEFETQEGSFIVNTLYKDDELQPTEKLENRGKKFTTLQGTALYWNPKDKEGKVWTGTKNKITMKVYDKKTHRLTAISELWIHHQEGYYSVQSPILIDEQSPTNPLESRLEVYTKDEAFDMNLMFIDYKGDKVYELFKTLPSKLASDDSFIKLKNNDYTVKVYTEEGKVEEYLVWLNLYRAHKATIVNAQTQKGIRLSEEEADHLRGYFMDKEIDCIRITDWTIQGEIQQIEPSSQDECMEVYFKENKGNSNVTLTKEDIKKYNIKVGDVVELKVRHTEMTKPEVIQLIRLNLNEEKVIHDIGAQYAIDKGLQPLISDFKVPLENHTIDISQIYGDENRVLFNMSLEQEEADKEYSLELIRPEHELSVLAMSYTDSRGSSKVEVRGENLKQILSEGVVFKVRLKEKLKKDLKENARGEERVLEEGNFKLVIPKEKFLESYYYEGEKKAYFTNEPIKIEEIKVYPTMMKMKIGTYNKGIQGREVTSLYNPVVTGNRQGLYNSVPNLGESVGKDYFMQGIMPSMYFDANDFLYLKAEGYYFRDKTPQSITVGLENQYPLNYSQGGINIKIDKVRYDKGELTIIIRHNEAIRDLISLEIDGKEPEIEKVVRDQIEKPDLVYKVKVPYKESYEITPVFYLIAHQELSAAIDLTQIANE